EQLITICFEPTNRSCSPATSQISDEASRFHPHLDRLRVSSRAQKDLGKAIGPPPPFPILNPRRLRGVVMWGPLGFPQSLQFLGEPARNVCRALLYFGSHLCDAFRRNRPHDVF